MNVLSGRLRFLGAFSVFAAVVGVLLVTARAERTTPTVESLVKQSASDLSSGCSASGCRPSTNPVRWSSVAAPDIGSVFRRAR